ncbi:MAG: pyrimidine-nucleoside phosphorylase, partial [Oscillospiraceae bacterium]
NKNDSIDMSAGIVMQKTVGDYIGKGEAIAFLHTNRHEVVNDASRLFIDAIKIGGEKPPAEPLIYEIIKPI